MSHSWLTPLYDPLTRLLGIPALHRTLLRQADVRPANSVLEIGCGTGNLTVMAKRRHPGAAVVGVDPDTSALRVAERKSQRGDLDIDWQVGYGQDLPFADATFDRVLSAMMLHHLDPDDRCETLHEARRVLRVGGSLHLVDFGGRTDPADGVMARRAARQPRLAANYGDGVLALLGKVGFASVTEESYVVSRLLGRITFYHADTEPVPVPPRS